RGPDGAWQRLRYGEMHRLMRALGQAFLDLGLSPEHPLVILSGNSIAHALSALGAQYAGIPSAAVAPAYSLMAEGCDKLRAVRDQITPGAVFVADTRPFARALAEVFPGLPGLGRAGPGLARDWADLLATPPGPGVEAAHAATG